MVAKSIAVVHTAINTGYTGPYFETVLPSETDAHAETKTQLETKA